MHRHTTAARKALRSTGTAADAHVTLQFIRVAFSACVLSLRARLPELNPSAFNMQLEMTGSKSETFCSHSSPILRKAGVSTCRLSRRLKIVVAMISS